MMEPETNRRGFIAAIYGIWGAIAAAVGLPAAAYLLLPPRTKQKDDWVDVGSVSALGASGPQEVVFRRNRKDGWKIISEKTSAWITRQNGQLVAFAPGCTHLGCAYHWDEKNKNFLCPCHTSTFGVDGKVLAGPAPRPLDQFKTRTENGKLLLGPVVQSAEVSALLQDQACPRQKENA
ncbi:MAG: ubiquinol-cytochrome c reductase iron-sulfur subunit [Bryobacterales bacterium]|nr:ubiquinol-cytochrome c reductase iron-sulfur subunit [Bryobacterales bacterium]